MFRLPLNINHTSLLLQLGIILTKTFILNVFLSNKQFTVIAIFKKLKHLFKYM